MGGGGAYKLRIFWQSETDQGPAGKDVAQKNKFLEAVEIV